MAKQLVEFELEDGSSVIFESTGQPTRYDDDDDGMERVSRGGGVDDGNEP